MSLIIGDPPKISDPSRLASQSSQGHWNRHGSMGYIWLTVKWSLLTMGLPRTVSETNGDFGRKLQNTFLPACI